MGLGTPPPPPPRRRRADDPPPGPGATGANKPRRSAADPWWQIASCFAAHGQPMLTAEGTRAMAAANDWNAQIIKDFRANEGRVGGNFEGAPITLLHHVGRRSGRESVAPVMYLADEDDPSTIFVFASLAGAP